MGSPKNVDEQLKILLRGATKVVSEAELRKKLALGRPLRVKLGVDPTAPDIHLGHTVVLTKLRTFQDLGHHVVFIIGDFTAAIGDPSGRDSTRPPLSVEQINANTKTYTDQVFKILDRTKTEVRANGEWLNDLFDRSQPEFLPRGLLRRHTVQQLMERDDFTERRKAGQPISLLELMYPLFQGYDSVAVKADVELGGNDQLFNLLMGRQIQKDAGMDQQVVLTFPLLEGLDGVQKMSKSYGNHVGLIDASNDMFAKIMSISDAMMWKYFELLTQENVEEVKKIHPMEAKKKLAWTITNQYHGGSAADQAKENFAKVFSQKGTPEDVEDYKLTAKEMDIIDILVLSNLAPSKKEARRLLEQGGVELEGDRLEVGKKISLKGPAVLRVGKRRFKRLVP